MIGVLTELLIGFLDVSSHDSTNDHMEGLFNKKA